MYLQKTLRDKLLDSDLDTALIQSFLWGYFRLQYVLDNVHTLVFTRKRKGQENIFLLRRDVIFLGTHSRIGFLNKSEIAFDLKIKDSATF